MLLALISKSDCFLFSFYSLVFILLPTGCALLHGKPWRVKRIMTLKKAKVVIKTYCHVLPNSFNGGLNYMIKINQKAKYYMRERLLYCCSIILPLIILQFYCRSAAELAHTILFFFYHRIMTSESKIWLLFYPCYWSFFIQLLVFLMRWDSASQRVFFFSFFQLKFNEFFGAGEMENKKHGDILYHFFFYSLL